MSFNKEKKNNIFSQLIVYLHYIAIAALLFSLTSSYINPNQLWLASLFGLAFPIIYLLNFIIVVYLIFRGKKRAIYSIIILVIGFNQFNNYFHFTRVDSEKTNKENLIKVVSFNVHNFSVDHFGTFDNAAQKECFQFLENQDADIIYLQEFSYNGVNKYASNVQLKHRLKAKGYYYESYFKPLNYNLFGLVTYSKYPILNSGYFEQENSRKYGIYNDLLIYNDTVRVYNLHLESTKLTITEYSILEGQIDSTFNKKSMLVLNKLKQAIQIRANQAEYIADHIQNCTYSVIVCGDFNDSPTSFTYHEIKNDLIDAFEKADKGFGKTYRSIFPTLRIDYIFASKGFEVINYEELRVNLSDHFPVKSNLRFIK